MAVNNADKYSDDNEKNSKAVTEEAQPSASKLRKKEIKRILLGSMTRTQEGHFLSGNGAMTMPYGFRDGSLSVLLFGIKDKSYRYETTFRNTTQALYQTKKAMQDIGHIIELEAAPDSAVCLVSSFVLRPVVLLFEECSVNKELVLHVYCGRSMLSFIAVRRALSRFEKALPKQISRPGK